MDRPCYEIGVYRREVLGQPAAMLLRQWDTAALEHAIPWLRYQNYRGCDIYIRPAGSPHPLNLVDDLTAEAVAAMKQTGFDPAVIVETSPNNYQAWLKHPEQLDKETSTATARALAERFSGDRGAADWRHLGRCAGFCNRKPRHQDVVTGLFPFVRLIEAPGKVYPEANRFIAEVRRSLEEQRRRREHWLDEKLSGPIRGNGSRWSDLKSIDAFRSHPRYDGDGKRCDLAYAIYALSRGATAAQVEAAIRSRDLSHKGSERRQDDYVQRTIRKALEGVDRGR